MFPLNEGSMLAGTVEILAGEDCPPPAIHAEEVIQTTLADCAPRFASGPPSNVSIS